MSNYSRGIKRNKIIQRGLQGIEDPKYDVFPTKKEGMYIVKLRENQSTKESLNDPVMVSAYKLTRGISLVAKSDEKSEDNTPEDTEPEST